MARYCCSIDDVRSAAEDIKQYIHRTPLMTCSTLDRISGRKLFLKTENFQKTGSIKIRGATNVLVKLLKEGNKPNCVVTESSGNNGQAVAKAAQSLGIPCCVVMPKWSLDSKVNAIHGYGASTFKVNPAAKARAKKSKTLIMEHGGVFVSPSQNPRVMAGQGTVALEILEDNPDIDVIVASVGGGGLIGGIAIAAKAIKPSIKVIAAEPENANDCYLSKLKGEMLAVSEDPDTIADALRVNIGPSAWPVIRDLVDDVITVSENEIIQGMLTVWERAKLVIEPTTGVSIAAVMSSKFKRIKGENVAIVLCGGNVDMKSIANLLADK